MFILIVQINITNMNNSLQSLKHKKGFILSILLFAGFINGPIAKAQTVVTVGGGATITCPAVPTATWTTPPTGATFSNWSRGSGVNCASANNGLAGSSFNSADGNAAYTANKYFSVTITAGASNTFILSSIVWNTTVSGGSPDFDVMYSNNGGPVTAFGGTGTSTTSNTFSGNITIAPNTSIVLYMLVSGIGNNTRTARWLNGSTITLITPVNYYSKSTGNLNTLGTWGPNTDGSGTAPSNFTSAGQIFNIRNRATATISSGWTVSGAGSKIITGDGTNACNFTIPSGSSVTGTVDVQAQGTLTIQNNTVPTLGTLASTSTIDFGSTGAQTIPVNTYGNIIVSGSRGANDVTFAGGVDIAGDLTISATGTSGSGFLYFNNSGTARTFTISGDYIQSGYDAEFGSGSGSSTINLAGNFQKTGGYLTTTVAAANAVFNLSGANADLQSTGGTETKWINFNVLSGSVCTLNGQFNYFGSSGTPAIFTVNSGGTVNCGTFNFVTTGGFATFINNGTLGIGSSAGIASSGATGNIQTTTRTFSTAGFYVYNGTTQATGSGLPTTAITGGVTISNGATVTTTNAIIVNTTGVLKVDGILTPGAATQVFSGTGTLNGSGTVQVNRTAATADFLSQYTQTTKTLTNLTVEYTVLTGSQVVSATTYNNLKLNNTSGTNTSGGSVTVNGTLTLASGGAFSIGSNTHTFNGAVSGSGTLTGSNTSNLIIGGTAGTLNFTSGGTNNFLKNFTLNTGATATLGNALNITAYDGTSSEGVLTVTGTATLTTGGFLTIKSNANGTARIAAGRTTGGYISGDVTVERFIPQNSSKGWRLLASTTSGQTINQAWQEGVVGGMNNPNAGFGTKITAGSVITTNLATAQAAGFDTLSAGVSLFRYNAATDVLQQVTATNTGNIANEQGYFLFIRGDRSPGQFGAGAPATSTVLRSKGTLFTGDQAAVATGASNYGLVRNPYPSRIDMRNIVRGSNLIDAYQVWDAKLGGTYGVGGFQTFSKSGANYVVSPGGGSYGANGSVHNFIESGAAFFIQSTTNTNNTAQVTEACKTSASNTNSFRPSGVLADDKRITFTLYALNPGSSDVVDGGLIFFNDVYSNGVTVEDVRKSGNFNENFGMLRDNTELVVEKRKDVGAEDSIFFKMYQLRQISYRLDLAGLNFDPSVTTAVLQDKFTNTNTPLNLTTLTSYTFTVNATAGSFAQDRFRLVLSSSNIFSGTGNWTDNERWSRGVPPTSGDVAIIAAGANAVLNTDFLVAGSLKMTPTSTLEISPTKTLTISGTADFAGQSVVFRSDETGYGSLGQVTGTLNGATNVTVERYIPNNGFRSWRLLSVPTFGSGQTIRQAWQEGNANPLPLQNNLPGRGTQITGVFTTQAAAGAAGFDSTSVQSSILTWNGTGWSNVTSTNSPIANNKAYFLFVRGERSKGVTGAVNNSSATTLRTNGTIYTGNQVFNVSTNGFAVVANTYPSAISFTGLTRNNVNNLFYIWDSKKQNGNSLGVYQTFSAINSFNCLISGGSYTAGQPNTVIESGQAFFVTGGATSGGGTITLLESAKVSGSSGNLGLRPAAIPFKIDSRLLDANNDVLDANVVVFDKAYSKNIDTDDAVKLGNPGANFAIENAGRILAIEGTQPVSENDLIQFRMWNLKPQIYKLEFQPLGSGIQGLHAFVEDKYLNTSREIDMNSVTEMSFIVTDNPASSAPGRFRIVFRKIGVTENSGNGYTLAPNPTQGKTVNLLLESKQAGIYNIRIVTVEGKLLTTKTFSHAGGSSRQLIALPAGVTPGNYQVEIIAPDKSKTSRQLIVANMD